MDIKLLHTGPLGTNTYVVYGAAPGECFVVDPADAAPVLDFLRKAGLVCTHILLTHGHFDHVLGVAKLKEETGARVCVSAQDASALTGEGASLKQLTWGYSVPPCKPDVLLNGGETLQAAGFTLRALPTPGHTWGGISYVVDGPDKAVFAGDTLFRFNVGRCDLPGGDPYTLHASIQNQLFALPGDYPVYPGHDAPTTLEEERAHNPYMTQWGPEQW